MYVSDRRWQASLKLQPAVVQAGIGTHGVGAMIDNYSALGVWCLHVYRYHGQLRVNGEWYKIAPGFASLIPPGSDLEYHYRGKSQHAYAHFSLPAGGVLETSLAAMQDLGPRFAGVYQRMEEMIAFHHTEPVRAAVRLWDLLWQISEPHADAADEARMPDAVAQMLSRMELRLGQRLHIAALAAEVGISHNHLIRQFRRWVGTNPVQYLRRRRVERAQHLLTHTTMPVKAIAAEVGIPDLHLFNKVMRAEVGASPRQIRAASLPVPLAAD
jgi:AraC-like DNA-binding protein